MNIENSFGNKKEPTKEELTAEDFNDYGFVEITKDIVDPENPKGTYKKGYIMHQSSADHFRLPYKVGVITNSACLSKEEVEMVKAGKSLVGRFYEERT